MHCIIYYCKLTFTFLYLLNFKKADIKCSGQKLESSQRKITMHNKGKEALIKVLCIDSSVQISYPVFSLKWERHKPKVKNMFQTGKKGLKMNGFRM